MQSSTSIKPSQIQRKWHLIDANGQTLGRLSSQIAKLLIGKNKPYFVNHQDTGDYVVVVNAEKVKTTGKKLAQKKYYHHSGFPGGMKVVTLGQQLDKDARKVMEKAIRGMLPKTKLGEKMYAKLYVYSDDTHPHGEKFEVKGEKKQD
jgi:large subunit ribosomal protein L13